MNDYNNEVGRRLRLIRNVFNEGGKLTADQFAFLLGETRDKITNYELGRASIPIRLLFELYNRGINPIYLITGEGSCFAANKAGREFATKMLYRLENGYITDRKTIALVTEFVGNFENISSKQPVHVYKVSAGRLEKDI